MARSKKHYQWDAEQYAKYSGSQYEWALELIGKLQLQGAEDVLDIGCGDGKVTASIAERLLEGSVLGIDSSGEMIALARRRYGHYPTARLAFEYLDVRELDAVSRFDVVFSNAALHWIKEHGDVLRRVRQAMKTGARFLFQMGGRGNARDVVAVLEAMLSHRKWVSFFINFEFPYGFYGTDEYARWLAEAGLTPVRIALIEKDMCHIDQDGFAGWINTTWLPYLERIPDDRKEAFVRELIETYLQENPADAKGRVHVRMVRLEAEATRNS